ncbi:MAG: NrfD/PsrC family molybdoenzyme membrane anchor subunit [Bacteriovoracaceae bacterium]
MNNLDQRLSELGYSKKETLKKLALPAAFLMFVLFLTIYMTLTLGLYLWGINIPVAWGFAIINFVWWIGIGHAGTLISAILLLARQDWRNSINRLAETMTLFAVAAAGIFPILHMGRPQYFYWLLPYPNDMNLYPQYRSPLTWDAFAVSTYGLVSLLFWYVGLIPDLAIAREQSKNKFKRFIYAVLSLGFSGEIKEWISYKQATNYLAIIATPLVISVHTIVSLDFAAGINPGWHSTMFPPFFVGGAIYSGFAMVNILLIFIRHKFKLTDLISENHLEKCSKMLLLSGMVVTFFYSLEFFMAWYGDEPLESQIFLHRMFGEKAWTFWTMIFCNSFVIQLMWFKKFRRNEWAISIISLLVLIGMWMERYVIVITSLMDSYLPAIKGHYTPTIWDWGLYLGTFGLFSTGILIVLRFFPFIPITEIKEGEHHEGV